MSITGMVAVLLLFNGVAWYLYLIFSKKKIIKQKKHSDTLNKIVYFALGIILVALWIVATVYFIQDLWRVPTTNPLIALGATLAINIPFLPFTRHWHAEKQQADLPAVTTSGKATVFFAGCALLCFFGFLLTLQIYLMEIEYALYAVSLAFALVTLLNVSAALGSRWRILILEDSLVIRPRLGKTKEIAYEDIEKVEVDNPASKLELLQIFPKNRFAITAVTVNEVRLNYNTLLQKLKEKDVKFEYKFPPSITEPDLTDETTNTLNQAQES